MFTVELHFFGDLVLFLPREFREQGIVQKVLSEKTGVKDVIEACGVPHPEVDLIVACSEPAGDSINRDFAWQIQQPSRLEIYPVPAPPEILSAAPRLQQRTSTRFVADGHLGKLARNLRLLGLDTAYERDADDRRLIEIMVKEDRALLTRDRRLLMHSVVREGYCPRSADAFEQTQEVLKRFALSKSSSLLAPYRRCLRCNGLLEPVSKAEVSQLLASEPLTLRYYDEFRKCASCGKIYWPGTHFQKLMARVKSLMG